MRITSKLKNRILAWLMTCLCLMFCGALMFSYSAKAETSTNSSAYFLTEDRYTQGLWYSGEDGFKEDTPEQTAAKRNYGKDGAVLFFHWLKSQHSKPCLDVDKLNDFTHDTTDYSDSEAVVKANYVEYPSYVSSIQGNITSISDDPFGYWNNYLATMSNLWTKSINGVRLLPIEGRYVDDEKTEERLWTSAGFNSQAGAPTRFTVEMTDDNWHSVTYYVGCPYYYKYVGDTDSTINIYDLEGNLLETHTVAKTNQGVHVTFAVKGSFVIELIGKSLAAWSNALFFDPCVNNENIGVSDVSVKLEGAKQVKIEWENISNDTFTSIYRRVKGEKYWERLVELAPAVSSYVDSSTKVGTQYEYVLSSATLNNTDSIYNGYTNIDTDIYEKPKVFVKTFNLPDFDSVVEIATAPYSKTKLELAQSSYIITPNTDFTVKARLLKTDDNGLTWDPYSNIEVTYKLDGENIYSIIGEKKYQNIDEIFGIGVTDDDGYIEVTSRVEYCGDYNIVVSIEEQPDTLNMMTGYDACTASAMLSIVSTETANSMSPVLTNISDAIKPGETFNITGFNILNDESFKVAYVKNAGKIPSAFDENSDCKYISEKDILFVDALNGTSIMLTLPADERAGIYDFYIKNAYGWSNGITLNAARPLYLDQEGAYEGQEIQIVGRNFLQYEFGVGTLESSLNNLRVKLTQIKDKNGNEVNGLSYILSTANGGILTGNKIDKEDALQFENDKLQAEDIPYTHPLRITIKVPQVYAYGLYDITVATDGKDYRALTDNCKLEIVEKKSQSWDTSIFGDYNTTKHCGNDPLDLGVYWAQDLNYNNTVKMSPNAFDSAKTFTETVNTTISTLSNQGGGVVYFPEGTYYFMSGVNLKNGVMLIGAGEDKTIFEYVDNSATGKIWFTSSSQINIGIARVALNVQNECLQGENGAWIAPRYVVKWSGDGTYDEDLSLTTIKNRFIVNVDGHFIKKVAKWADPSSSEQYIQMTGKNIVLKNSCFDGGIIHCEMNSYGTMWGVKMIYNASQGAAPHFSGRYSFIENSYFDLQYIGHGLKVKSDQYVAYNYTTHTGNRVARMNDGEALLVEPPTGMFSTGNVIGATARTITLDFVGGEKIEKDTYVRYNMLAVYISDGTGQGQMRYIKRTTTDAYGACYEFQDWERDWDIIPDSTSVFSVIAPLANLTLYHYKAYDCVGPVCLYNNVNDAVVSGCTLIDTAGVAVYGTSSGGIENGRGTPSSHIRIVDNYIEGVGADYNVGEILEPRYCGGIILVAGGSGDYFGNFMNGIIVKNNHLKNLIPEISGKDDSKWVVGTGLVVNFKGGLNNNPNCARNIIIENNLIENTEWGLYCDRVFTGVAIKGNTVSQTTLLSENVTIDRPTGFYGNANHTLYVNGKVSGLSGDYQYETDLPKLSNLNGRTFLGWTEDENYTLDSTITTKAYGKNVTLYAAYGYEVVFDYNYLKSNGEQKGIYTSFKTLSGGSISNELANYGDPFRLGYEFGGWYLDEACTQGFDPECLITENVKVYAKWIGGNDQPIETPELPDTNGDTKPWIPLVVGVGIAAVIVSATVVSIVLIKRRKR